MDSLGLFYVRFPVGEINHRKTLEKAIKSYKKVLTRYEVYDKIIFADAETTSQ
jgi:hypothetical protein